MLPDRYRQLLTAYVDGVLNSRQRRLVVRLLHRSAEARQLLRRLKEDAHALRQLPKPSLPADLAEPVLQSIAERSLTPNRFRTVKSAPTSAWFGPFVSWAAAAAVLLALGVASFLYFALSLEQPATTETAQTQAEASHRSPPPAIPNQPRTVAEKGQQAAKSDEEIEDRKPPKAGRGKRETGSTERLADNRKQMADKPPPLPKEETALTESLEMFQLDRVPDLLPVVVKVSDLDRAPARTQVITELRKDSAFRLELPCLNGTKAFERVQSAARTLHIGLLIDKQAQERIKLKMRSNFALFIENVIPEELTEFVKQIGAEDRKLKAGKKTTEAQIDSLVLTRMTVGQRKELAILLGFDPFAPVPAATGPLGVDPRSSLSDATARQVERALAGQGGVVRPKYDKAEAKYPENTVLVLTYDPVRPSPGSEEIKHFLEIRKPARPGSIRVLLVLRSS